MESGVPLSQRLQAPSHHGRWLAGLDEDFVEQRAGQVTGGELGGEQGVPEGQVASVNRHDGGLGRQEGLTNALKHAHATQAEVALKYASDQLRIEVSDNGRGAAGSHGHGHGLIGIHERVKLYDGEMTTGTANGGGFTLTARLPLTGYRS